MLDGCKTKEEAAVLSRNGQEMLQKVESSSKPVIAAINGKRREKKREE